MKGDFSRLTFDSSKQFTRVLMQQGRVQLDADWNEQAAILLHYLQTLAADLIGPFGGPAGNEGFKITPVKGGGGSNVTALEIGYGRYYVAGLLCENPKIEEDPKTSSNPVTIIHPDNTIALRSISSSSPVVGVEKPDAKFPSLPFLVYLDVWERHITYVEDDGIREVALGGPDTATRAQVVWQVRWTDKTWDGKPLEVTREAVWENWQKWVNVWQAPERGKLKARARKGVDDTNPCTAAPGARYRGAENQLYRVEIQRQELKEDGKPWLATFKWSRDNGSRVFPVRRLQGSVATLEHLGRDGDSGLRQGDWVELVDDSRELTDTRGPLLRVEEIRSSRNEVTLKPQGGDPLLPVYDEKTARENHVLLRRWDHRAGDPSKGGLKLDRGAALFMSEGKIVEGREGWLTLEDGIEIQFQPGTYRPGDYWLIPVRTATGDVEWPGPPEKPEARPPHGVHHRYAPLALLKADGTDGDLRKQIELLGKPIP